MQLIKIISTELDKLNQRIAKLLRYGKNDIQTAVQIGPYGVDANPIKDMIALYAPTSEKGDTVVIGYINQNQVAATGEHRIFSTDDDGAVKVFVWLKKNGTLQIGGDVFEIGGNAKNLARYQELETAFNKLKDDHNSLVNAFNTHMHPTAGTGAPSPPTPGSGIPAQPSTADITGAKIDAIKTA